MINVNIELIRKLINNLPCFGKRKLYYHSLNYHPGTFISLAIENPHRLLIFSGLLKSDQLEGRFKEKSWDFLYAIECTMYIVQTQIEVYNTEQFKEVCGIYI